MPDYLVSHKLVVIINRHHKHSVYAFTLPNAEPFQKGTECSEKPEEEYSPLLIARLQEMVTGDSTERDQRIGTFILNMLDNDIERITTGDWVDAFHVTKQVYTSDLRRAVNLGLLRKENGHGMGTRCSYVVPKGPYSTVRCLDLTRLQQELLGKLYSCFKKKEFTIREAARGIGCNECSVDFHLSNFVERGIMEIHAHPEYPGRAQGFSFLVFPKDYPQCFMLDAGQSFASSGRGYTTEPVPMAAASA